MPRLLPGQLPVWRRFIEERLPALAKRSDRAITLIREWITLFLSHLLTAGYQPSTVRDYYYFLLRFSDWCEENDLRLVRRIQKRDVAAFLKHRISIDGVSRHSIRFHRHKLCVYFAYLQGRGVIRRSNPAAGIGFYQGDRRKPRRVLTREECTKLVRSPLRWDGGRRPALTPDLRRVRAHRDAAILALMLGSGLRRTEVAELSLTGLALDQGLLRVVGKGRQRLFRVERDVFVHPVAKREIRIYLALTGPRSTGPLFLCLDGEPMHPHTVGQIPPRYGRLALGRHVTAHLLRHTFATHVIQRGADPHSAQRLLGHKDVATTLHYYLHLTPDEVRDEWRASCPVKGSRP